LSKKTLPPIAWLKPRLAVTRALCLGLLAALLLALLLWNGLFADLNGARLWLVLSIELAPLLIVLPGVLLGKARAHAWLCFVLNLYFIKGVLASLYPARQWFGFIEIGLSVALFIAALLYVRWRFQYERHLADKGELAALDEDNRLVIQNLLDKRDS